MLSTLLYMTFNATLKPLIVSPLVLSLFGRTFSIPWLFGLSGRRALQNLLQVLTPASARLLSLRWNAVVTLHRACILIYREYVPVGYKNLAFAEWATDKKKVLIIGSAEALPILCVSDFCERERERERETPVTSLIPRWNREWSCIWLPRRRADPTRRRVLSARTSKCMSM